MFNSRIFNPLLVVIFIGLTYWLIFVDNKPSAPKHPEKLELAAKMVLESVEPGMTLQKDSTNVEVWNALKSAGSFGAYVSNNGKIAILRMSGFPRNHVFFYRTEPIDSAWTQKMTQLDITQVGDHWYWRECSKGRMGCFQF